MAIDPAKESSWFPQLTMLAFLLSGLVFHVLGLSSLRDVVATMGNLPELRLGPVRRSTLSDALNSKRRLKVVREIFTNLVDIFREHCPRRLARFKQIAALDSTLLHCVASAAWAKYRKKINACKAHLLFDLASGIPDKLVISEGRVHDRKCFSTFLRKGWTYIVDRAYNAYKLFDHMIDEGIFFVTRLKKNAVYEVVRRNRLSRSQKKKGVVSDEIVHLGSGPTLMRNDTRLITFRDKEGKEFRFLTNRFDLAPATIAALYHARWAIEIFFKWFKRTLRGERFLARSDVAAEIHVLIALLADILLKILAHTIKPVPSPQILRHVPVAFLRIVRYFLLKPFQLSVLRRLETSLE
jgi:putative transposase